MHVSDQGRAFIGAQEGLRLRTYRDAVGVLTIGYGHTSAAGPPIVNPYMIITKQQADSILARDLVKYEDEILREVHVPLLQCQFDALVSFTYNVGVGALAELVRVSDLNAHVYSSVPRHLPDFDHAGGRVLLGLYKRRHAEAAMFEGRYPWLPGVKMACALHRLLGGTLGRAKEAA